VIDIGVVYAEKIKLSNALDSAALAAALELPQNRDKAIDIAIEYIQLNNIDPEIVNIQILEDNREITIKGNKEVSNAFGKIFGVDKSTVKTTSTVIVGPVKSVKGGLRPFAVEAYDFSYGDVVTLKEGAGNGYHGNYGVVALGGRGACTVRNNVLYGYDGIIKIGDMIDTEPGNMASVVNTVNNYIKYDNSTFDDFDRDSIRIWSIPLVDTLEVNGRKKVEVIGFAQFYIEDIKKKSGKAEITGRFIKYVANGEIDMAVTDYGTYGVKLIK
jgi:hypothetical protein